MVPGVAQVHQGVSSPSRARPDSQPIVSGTGTYPATRERGSEYWGVLELCPPSVSDTDSVFDRSRSQGWEEPLQIFILSAALRNPGPDLHLDVASTKLWRYKCCVEDMMEERGRKPVLPWRRVKVRSSSLLGYWLPGQGRLNLQYCTGETYIIELVTTGHYTR